MFNGEYFPKIENLAEILQEFKPEILHPDDPNYLPMWRKLKKKCLDGIWHPQFGKLRYVPGRLGFFGVYGRFTDWGRGKVRVDNVIPKVRDLEWMDAYERMVCDGFSGFDKDDKYTCNEGVLDIENVPPLDRVNLYTKNGNLKEYVDPMEYLVSLHDEPLGKPLYENIAKNSVTLGSRGGGKSYQKALLHALYDICFKGAKSSEHRNTKAELEITSVGGGKGTDLVKKIEDGMNALKDPRNKDIGVWVYENGIVEPCYFYKIMMGSVEANNRENPWSNRYPVKVGNEWKYKGNGDYVVNTSYSDNQKGATQKSSGGRRTWVANEEIGLNPNFLASWGANKGLVSEGGVQVAPQFGIGTSGDMEVVKPAQTIFENPRSYNCVEYYYNNDKSKTYCKFLPVYMVDNRFKDENGNTDIEKAKNFHTKILKELEESAAGNPDVILQHRMHFPIEIDDMFIGGDSKLLPYKEAEERMKQISSNYKDLSTPIKLYWKDSHEVGYELDTENKAYYHFPIETERVSVRGSILMYVHPDKIKVRGAILPKSVFVLHDPYVGEGVEEGESLGATYVVTNPGFQAHGVPPYKILAVYISKEDSIQQYNENIELLCAFYGVHNHSLWYESNRGDKVRGYFIQKKKHHLLSLKPQFEQGKFIYSKNASNFGYDVPNKIVKSVLINGLKELLLTDISYINEDGELVETKVIYTIDDYFTLAQIARYNLKDNFDGVSALLAWSLAIGEYATVESLSSSQGKVLNTLNNALKRTRRYANS